MCSIYWVQILLCALKTILRCFYHVRLVGRQLLDRTRFNTTIFPREYNHRLSPTDFPVMRDWCSSRVSMFKQLSAIQVDILNPKTFFVLLSDVFRANHYAIHTADIQAYVNHIGAFCALRFLKRPFFINPVLSTFMHRRKVIY